MGTVTPPPAWPADREHRDAIETLLAMAESENRWGDRLRALELLTNAERIVGRLPAPYDTLRARCARPVGVELR
jgi:hypothetical protein